MINYILDGARQNCTVISLLFQKVEGASSEFTSEAYVTLEEVVS